MGLYNLLWVLDFSRIPDFRIVKHRQLVFGIQPNNLQYSVSP